MLAKFDEQAQKVVVLAESIAFDLGHINVGSEHLLLALLKTNDSLLKKVANQQKVYYENIKEDVIELFGSNEFRPFYMEYTTALKTIVENAIQETKKKAEEVVTTEILIKCLLSEEDSVAVDLLTKYKIDVNQIITELTNKKKHLSELDKIPDLININEKVISKKITIIGRIKETEQLIQILSRKQKANPLIVGDAGVGKTALIENLALLINEDRVPEKMKNKIIYELDLASVIAGTKYRGEFEDKLKRIIKKVKECKEAIIFIDEIHNIVGAGGAEGAIDAANILKPYLARNEFVCIGATTFDEYYKHLEKDKALERRFQTIMLDETSAKETIEILKGLKANYEKFHNVTIVNKHLNKIVELSDSYIKHRHFPDKALDVLDSACVRTIAKKEKKVSEQTIIEVVEDSAKVKINSVNKIANLKKELRKNILGQNIALGKVIEQLSYIDAGLIDENKPLSVMLFAGPTGVGKTEVAKLIAKHYFGGVDKLVKVDMSEFMEPHSVSKLIGSPPGYVGHDSTSIFTDKIRKQPFSVLLLDEIEKAHKDVLNVFLQIFDEGYITDSHKRKVSFKNTVIIMTSNLGHHKDLFNKQQLGFNGQNEVNDIIHQEINNYFSDEFINRIDEIISFSKLETNSYRELTKLYLKQYDSNLNLNLEISEDLVDAVIDISNIDKYGVRTIKKSIKKIVFPKVINERKNLEKEESLKKTIPNKD